MEDSINDTISILNFVCYIKTSMFKSKSSVPDFQYHLPSPWGRNICKILKAQPRRIPVHHFEASSSPLVARQERSGGAKVMQMEYYWCLGQTKEMEKEYAIVIINDLLWYLLDACYHIHFPVRHPPTCSGVKRMIPLKICLLIVPNHLTFPEELGVKGLPEATLFCVKEPESPCIPLLPKRTG